MVDPRKSLLDLGCVRWEDADQDTTLIKTCRALLSKPLADFTVEDLRIMIGQGFGMEYLMVLAIEKLDGDPLVEGDFYPGDLLHGVLTVDPGFWIGRDTLRGKVQRIAAHAKLLIVDRNESRIVQRALEEGLQKFNPD